MHRVRLRLYLPLLLIVITLLFIWSNSMMDANASTGQSDLAGRWFRELFDVEKEPFRFLYENRRKVAHFTEFTLLGAESCLFLLLNFRTRVSGYLMGGAACFLVACLDETIQLFSPGRVASFSDVCLDTAGALSGMLFVGLLGFLIFWGKKAKHREGSSGIGGNGS